MWLMVIRKVAMESPLQHKEGHKSITRESSSIDVECITHVDHLLFIKSSYVELYTYFACLRDNGCALDDKDVISLS